MGGMVGPLLFREWLGPRFRFGRTTIFSASACFSVFPVVQYTLEKGMDHLVSDIWIIFGVYAIGVMIYALRIPER
jgi:predicted membrane channel-forming protein YqfA (hemolysin III family)